MSNPRFSRRRFITSAGVTVTLPMLPSLLWSPNASAAASCAPIKRFMAYHFPNGYHMADSMPTGTGSTWTLPTALTAFAPVKSDIVVVSGLENQSKRRALGDHAIGCGALFTARMPTANSPVSNTSVDQAIADQLAGCRGIHSVQFGTESTERVDSFGTYYTRNISWKGTTTSNSDGSKSFPAGAATPLGKEIDPAKAFNRLFQGTDPAASAGDAEKRRVLRQSVLDAVVPHGDWLKNKLNAEDRTKVDQLFTGIRSLEQEITSSANAPACTKPQAPAGSYDVQSKIEIFHTLMGVAFQCDVTRVISFMMGDALSLKNLSFIPDVKSVGGNSAHHSVSHHGGDTALINKFKAMVKWEIGLIAGFIQKLKTLTDADGKPVLDNTLVVIGSEIGDGDRHNHDDLLLITAGKLGGAIVTDRHKRFTPGSAAKSFGDFYITAMGLYGLNVPSYGNDGNEAIEWHK